MDISFKEKSVWSSLIITVLIFGYYFARVFTALREPVPDTTAIIRLFIGMVLFMIVIEIVTHIVLAITFRKEANEEHDERDKLIELKSTKISYWILISGVLITGVNMLTMTSPLVSVNILWFMFILAEVTGDITKLYYYRKGV